MVLYIHWSIIERDIDIVIIKESSETRQGQEVKYSKEYDKGVLGVSIK